MMSKRSIAIIFAASLPLLYLANTGAVAQSKGMGKAGMAATWARRRGDAMGGGTRRGCASGGTGTIGSSGAVCGGRRWLG